MRPGDRLRHEHTAADAAKRRAEVEVGAGGGVEGWGGGSEFLWCHSAGPVYPPSNGIAQGLCVRLTLYINRALATSVVVGWFCPILRVPTEFPEAPKVDPWCTRQLASGEILSDTFWSDATRLLYGPQVATQI